MKDIEIPLQEEKGIIYRFFEILPAVLSWLVLLTPAILSFINAFWAAVFIAGFVFIWFARSLAMSYHAVHGFHSMRNYQDLDWQNLLHELDDYDRSIEKYTGTEDKIEKIHLENLKIYSKSNQQRIQSKDLVHLVLIAVYNETQEIVEPTVQYVVDSNYDTKNLVVVFAYEERGGPEVEKMLKGLVKKYKKHFRHMDAVKHPDKLPNEVIGKGGNITWAGQQMLPWVRKQGIPEENVIVTTLDADNRPHPNYFASLSYTFLLTQDRQYKSYQPIAVYTNNIWDVPAPMRVIALGNSFWWIIMSLRPHLLRNFSAHAQGLKPLIDTDFWSVRTIVEDGHQFWRTYFRHDGKHDVVPLFTPIYQDAVLADKYHRTYKAQFIQLRRWTWGASDIAYVAKKGFFTKNNLPKIDLIMKFTRLVDGHVSWASASLILAFAAWAPLFISPDSDELAIAHQLPVFMSRLQTLATLGILLAMIVSLRLIPPRPKKYTRWRRLLFIVQWALVPIISIVYGSLTALYSQTRLALGLYLAKFDVTEKAIKK